MGNREGRIIELGLGAFLAPMPRPRLACSAHRFFSSRIPNFGSLFGISPIFDTILRVLKLFIHGVAISGIPEIIPPS